MHIELNNGKYKKSKDTKKTLPDGAQTHRPHCHESEVSKHTKKFSRDQNDTIQTKKSEKSLKSSGLLSQLKELNIKRRSQKTLFLPVKNKENKCHNKNKSSSGLTTSLTTNCTTILGESKLQNQRQFKINTGQAMANPSKKCSSNTALHKQSKIIRFDQHLARPCTVKNREQPPRLNNPKKHSFSINDFELGHKLGKGRFGNVYLAEEKATKFVLAIKIINKQQVQQSDMQSQLIEQIRLQMFSKHPNILKMYGCFCDKTNIYMLLQLGTSCLFKQLRTNKYFSQEKTAYYLKQVIQALKYLHSQNIIHRDIKPENILMLDDVLKLSDFGWSTYSPIQKRQTFCGTLDYVPPQIVRGQFYDERVDIWSLGVLCYELAIGRAPFEDRNDQEGIYNRILSVELEFPQHISIQLRDLISKILVCDPKKRLALSQIEKHPWYTKHGKVGRYISKEVWESWQGVFH